MDDDITMGEVGRRLAAIDTALAALDSKVSDALRHDSRDQVTLASHESRLSRLERAALWVIAIFIAADVGLFLDTALR
ncbi:MAG: hypothetical protein LBJ62_05820 [Bifidobacteriaceae bacterium]|jgi:hypothetical protein|nr:hypothetical protein [Bifidobacteriaceae bacterium]